MNFSYFNHSRKVWIKSSFTPIDLEKDYKFVKEFNLYCSNKKMYIASDNKEFKDSMSYREN